MKEMQSISFITGVKRGFMTFVSPPVSSAAKVSFRDFTRLLKEDVSLVRGGLSPAICVFQQERY